MKHVSLLYNAFVLALAVGLVSYGTWRLQMAFNTGYIFFGVLILLVVALEIAYRKRDRGIGLRGTCVSLVVMVLCGLVPFGPTKAAAMAPAAFVREGLHQNYLSLNLVQGVLLALLIAGLVAVFVDEVRHPRDPDQGLDPDEARTEQTSRLVRWISFAVLSVIVALCSCVPAAREQLGQAFTLLMSGDINAVATLIRSYGFWAAGVSALLMVLQSLAAPIPAFLITFANAAVFGWWQGAILSWASAMLGAAVCFYIARLLGRDVVARFVTHSALKSIDKFFERYGTHAILICRLLPFMPFDYVSYAAGLTGVTFRKFFIATGIGQLPATIVYSYVGGMLTGSVQTVVTALLIMFALFTLVALVRLVFKNRHADLMADDAVASADEK